MNQFEDVMLDVETMGLPPNGALLQIGAVFFSEKTQTLGPRFQKNIHLASAVREGGTMDPATVLWWLGQGEEARKVRFGGEDIKEVLKEFRIWIAQTCRFEDVRVYGNGATFDLPIVESAYQRIGVPVPWYWSNQRCFRTIRNRYPSVVYDAKEKGDAAHEAVVDAEFQVRHLFKVRNSLKGVQ